MARPRTNPLKEARSCLTLFTHSRSTRWPSRTGLATDILLFLSILFAVAQLGLCVAMAHRLLTSPQSEVECLNVDAGSNFDFTNMAIYFGFALAAAYINRKTDAQQSMRLDDLSGSSALTPAQQNLRDFPSSGISAQATPVPMNNFGLTFIDGTPNPSSQQPKAARSRTEEEDLEARANPFTDPANVVPPEPARQWR
ncbi:hypothetical protein J4E83_004738 [Alternaria metachromatica]|uniref:uncharacterized protein n=1 Tax=Alternaria metachromatica TaxID=283354 RepID=UPI0020C25A04|nr:uncharacterized protein J4E83_004738 [Alternaria metachromatica]KAI4623345.1 hypothetical protein J4E83_004738 [Alternaria metachromatica]